MWWCVSDKVLKKTHLDLQKTFPDIPCVSQMLGSPSLRLGTPQERLSIPSGSGKGWKNAGWLVTWDSPLRTDSASLKPLESFIQLISFCSSWILAVSSRIVSRSSINLLLEDSSNVDPWNRFNSSISSRLFSWASRRSRFCSNNCSWISCWSRRCCSSPWWAWSISLRWDSIIQFNSWILLVSESAWHSCFWISALKSARICVLSFKENPDCFVFTFATWFFLCCTNLTNLVRARVSSVLECAKMNELATNFLHESYKLVFGPLILFAPERTVVRRALSRWSHRRLPRHTSTRAPFLCRPIPPGRSFQ